MKVLRCKTARTFVLSIISLIVCSCSIFCKPDIIVKNQAGKPLEGVKLYPASMSITYSPVFTDSMGRAWLGYYIQPPEWVGISKNGYEMKTINYTNGKTIIVKLEPIQ